MVPLEPPDASEGQTLGDVEILLAAADAGARVAKLDADLEALVARALASRAPVALRAASRGLRACARWQREDGQPVPPRLVELLAGVRAALRAPR